MLTEILTYKKRVESLTIFLCSIFILLVVTHFRLIDETIDAVILYLILPSIIGVLVLKMDFKSFGFSIGNWKTGLILTLMFSLITAAVVYLAVRYYGPVIDYYASREINPKIVLETVVYMFSWEFFLRGFILFGLKENTGLLKANIIQTLLFFISHWNKLPLEFYSTIATGMLFGYIAYRSKSFWPVAVIHFTIYISVIAFSNR